MPGAVIGKSLNYGFPGSVSRSADTIINNRPVQSTDTNSIAFGSAAILNSNDTYSAAGATASMSNFAGVAVREVKQSTSWQTTGMGAAQYNPGDPCDIIQRGSVTVVCQNGTPSAGGPVYLRTALNAGIPNAVIGGFEAVADGTNSFQVTNAEWKTGKIDANNVSELTLLTRNKA